MFSSITIKADRIRGHVLVLFVVWFLVALFGIFHALVIPEKMAVLGPLGDWFGVLNPIFGLITVLAALLNLHYLTVQVADQRKVAENQKRHDLRNLLREKLENVVLGTRQYIALCVGSAPLSVDQVTMQWLDQYLLTRVAAMAGPEILTRLYFPLLRPHIEAIMTSNEALSTCLRTVGIAHCDFDKRKLFGEMQGEIKALNKVYQDFFAFVMNNSDTIISGSPVMVQMECLPIPEY
jgi:uncharacterized membrane protein